MFFRAKCRLRQCVRLNAKYYRHPALVEKSHPEDVHQVLNMVINSAWGIISERNLESTEDDIQISEDSDNQDGVTSNKPKKRPKRYPCPKCGKGFAQFPSATKHSKHCLNTTVEKGVSCHICGTFIKLKKNLKRHLNDHKASKVVRRPSGSLRCEGCGRCFSTLQRLTSHMESKHGVKQVASAASSEVFSCSLC